MDRAKRTWEGNWLAKILTRIRAAGYTGVMDYLTRFPAMPYNEVAEFLGDDVAAAQLERMHFEEAKSTGRIRHAAMDSLTRALTHHLRSGWRHGAKGDFETSSAFAAWATPLDLLDPSFKESVDAVWKSLEELNPSFGWLPKNSADEYIVKAFQKGWPESDRYAV